MTIKEYKKRYYICEDDFGNKLYAGDTVELYSPMELKTSWTSKIYWSVLYGACVDSHPTHKIMHNNPDKQRHLYTLLNQEPWIIWDTKDNCEKTYKGYCKKIKSFNK